jgi:glucuronoarabinoxylan endo-1,4-beta-xylanase
MKRQICQFRGHKIFIFLLILTLSIFPVKSQEWSGFINGVNYWVQATAAYNRELIVGGDESIAMGQPTEYENSTIKLEQNIPNPFRISTQINYSVNQPGNVHLIVFDQFGQVKDILVNGYLNSGNYSVLFKAEDLPNGHYIYRLESGTNVETRKMFILK